MKYTISLFIILFAILGFTNITRAEDIGMEGNLNAGVQINEQDPINVNVDASGKLVLPPPVASEGETNASFRSRIMQKRDELRGKLEMEREKIQMYGENREEKLADFKAKAEARREEVKARFTETMQARFEAAISRFSKLIDRLSSRIEKIKALGGDTTRAETSLSQARAALEATIGVMGSVSISDSTDANAMEANKTAIDRVKSSMKSIEAYLRDTIDALKVLTGNRGQGLGNGSVQVDTNTSTQ